MNSNEIDDENLDLIDVDVELDLSDEVWKELDGYNGRYSLSNYGRVRNNKWNRCLTLRKSRGKIRTTLSVNGDSVVVCIEDLVGSYFPETASFSPTNYEQLNMVSTSPNLVNTDVTETWRDIAGFEGLYQVSDQGRLKRLPNQVIRAKADGTNYTVSMKERLIGPRSANQCRGYTQVSLSRAGVVTHDMIHRIVATTFIPNPLGLPQVNHLDGNKANNAVENLEWTTAYDNMSHARSTGLLVDKGADSARAKLTWEDVRYIRGDHRLLQRELADMFGVSSSTIQRVVKYEVYKNEPMEETKNGETETKSKDKW